jgi:hypothetical protein
MKANQRNSLGYLALAVPGLIMQGCGDTHDDLHHSTATKVEIIASDDGYRLHRGGEPYLIKGAGLEYGDIESFAAHGGNSIRTWTTENDAGTAREVLDQALANGVTVSLGLQIGAEHWGFDYDDPAAVAAQLEYARDEVLKYRDHPALLVWIIGNELNLNYTNPKVYDAVNDISEMIHELDPYHPTTTTVAGLDARVLANIESRAPDIDFVSFQVYGELENLPAFLDEQRYQAPFFVTEWGAIGYWEVEETEWGAPIEATSTEKAETYLRGYREKLAPLDGRLLGSYVFLWGQKQERTPTWFGLFTEAGEETEAVDVMHYIWNGAWPDNRSPSISKFVLDGKTAAENVRLRAGQGYRAAAELTDHEGDALTYRWELKPESDATQSGGQFEESIESLELVIDGPADEDIEMTAPLATGPYRLFIYASDGQGHVAHANIPFFVDP